MNRVMSVSQLHSATCSYLSLPLLAACHHPSLPSLRFFTQRRPLQCCSLLLQCSFFSSVLLSVGCSYSRPFAGHWGANDNSVWLGGGQEISIQSALNQYKAALVWEAREAAGAQGSLVELVILKGSLN